MKNNAKLIRLGIALSAITLFFVACDKKENNPTPPVGKTEIDVTEHTFNGISGDQSLEITIKAANNWTASLSTSTWLSATPTSGKAGETKLTIRPTRDNAGMTVRNAILTFYVDEDDKDYEVKIQQRGADSYFTIDNTDLSLTPNTTGRTFADTLTIESNRKWTIVDAPSWLSFTYEGTPTEGVTTKVALIVKADYNKFPSLTPAGEFKVKVDEDDKTTVKVNATAICDLYTSDEMTTKVTTLELVKDLANPGLYDMKVYFKANIEWNISQLPDWASASIANNVTATGDLTDNPTMVMFQVKKDMITTQELSGTVLIKDTKSSTLHSLPIHFAGTGADFLEVDIKIPSQDKFGEDFMFDPLAGTDRITQLAFTVRTSRDYTSIAEAPFKVLSLATTRGIIERKEVRWVHISMGDPTKSTVKNGIYQKEIILNVNERNDQDDKDKVTILGAEREANLFFVNKTITMNDLFADATSITLKEEYQGTYIKQKNALIAYKMSVDGIVAGTTIEVPTAGWETRAYNMITDSPKFSAEAVWDAPGMPHDKAPAPWVKIDFPMIEVGDIKIPDPTRFLITVDDASGSSFAERKAKVSFKAFRGLDENGVPDQFEMFTFYVKQKR